MNALNYPSRLWRRQIAVPGFIIFVLVGLTFLLCAASRASVLAAHRAQATFLAAEKASHVQLVFRQQVAYLELLRSTQAYVAALTNPTDAARIADAQERIEEMKGVIPGIGLMDTSGTVIVAESIPAGTDFGNHPYFDVARTGVYFDHYFDPSRNGEFFGAVTPVYASAATSSVVGYMFCDVPLGDVGDVMASDVDIGEVYLIDRAGLLLSASRYVGQDDGRGVLVQEVKSEGARECLEDLVAYSRTGEVEEHEEEERAPYLNYIGELVIGAHAYVPEIMGCVIAEIPVAAVPSLSASLAAFVAGITK